MTKGYDKTLCERLKHQAREAWEIGHPMPSRDVVTMADQLDSAQREMGRLTSNAVAENERQRRIILQNSDDWKALRAEHETQRAEVDRLRATAGRFATAFALLAKIRAEGTWISSVNPERQTIERYIDKVLGMVSSVPTVDP